MSFRRSVFSIPLPRRSLPVQRFAGPPVRPPPASALRSLRLPYTPVEIDVTLGSRALHTTRPRTARYERFDSRPSVGSSGYSGSSGPLGGGPGGWQAVWAYLRRRLGGDRAIYVYGFGLGGAGLYYVLHLERVPGTGRLRFMDVSEASERELGYQTQLQTLQQYSTALLPPNHPQTRRVRNVAARIIESSGLGRVKTGGEMGHVEARVPAWHGGGGPDEGIDVGEIFFGGGKEAKLAAGKETEWEVYVIDDKKTKNAFVLPGGKIFVFTGILPVSQNDDGLATVLGHEVAHQVARHPAERMSYMKVLFVAGLLLESLGLDVGVSRALLALLLQLPNSRTSESEADQIGLRLMSRACFNPEESTRMWQRMSESEKSSGVGGSIDFLSTHPANAKRIKQLHKWMPEAQAIRAGSPCGATSQQFGGFLDTLGAANQGMGRTFWG